VGPFDRPGSPLHDGVSLTHDSLELAYAQGGVTLVPEQGELDAGFPKFDVDVEKWLQLSMNAPRDSVISFSPGSTR
jgi:hypothetical protein